MNVDVMLSQVTSTQLTEWAAYEQATGPLDDRYLQEALASIHEAIQRLTHLTGFHFVTKENKKNPAPKPQPYPRMWVVPEQEPEEEDEDEETANTPGFGPRPDPRQQVDDDSEE